MLEPSKGLITFRSEGNNFKNNQFYSRVIHWPERMKLCDSSGAASGVTIGRGYDMKHRSRASILRDLRMAGIPLEQAHKISFAAKLHKCQAGSFVLKNKNDIGEITEAQQVKLFNLTYPAYESDAHRFYNKYKSNNSVQWEYLNLRIRDVLIDMKYQGNLRRSDILIFEKNNVNEIIELILSTPRIRQYEAARNRVNYLRGDS